MNIHLRKFSYLVSASNSGVTRSTSGWSTTIPTMNATKKYLWNYEDILYTSGSHAYSTPVIIGAHGANGTNGTNGTNGEDGEDGRGITSITNYYLVSTNSTGVTRTGTTGWNTTVPTLTSTNKYLWNYEDVLFSDNTHEYTDARIIGVYGDKGNDGTNGTSVTVSSTSVKYAVSNNSSQPADSSFTYTSVPSVSVGQYLWSMQVVTFSNGTSIKSYSVSRIGADGSDGDDGLDGKTTHFAYSTSSDGSANFSTTIFNGATYIGTYDH